MGVKFKNKKRVPKAQAGLDSLVSGLSGAGGMDFSSLISGATGGAGGMGGNMSITDMISGVSKNLNNPASKQMAKDGFNAAAKDTAKQGFNFLNQNAPTMAMDMINKNTNTVQPKGGSSNVMKSQDTMAGNLLKSNPMSQYTQAYAAPVNTLATWNKSNKSPNQVTTEGTGVLGDQNFTTDVAKRSNASFAAQAGMEGYLAVGNSVAQALGVPAPVANAISGLGQKAIGALPWGIKAKQQGMYNKANVGEQQGLAVSNIVGGQMQDNFRAAQSGTVTQAKKGGTLRAKKCKSGSSKIKFANGGMMPKFTKGAVILGGQRHHESHPKLGKGNPGIDPSTGEKQFETEKGELLLNIQQTKMLNQVVEQGNPMQIGQVMAQILSQTIDNSGEYAKA